MSPVIEIFHLSTWLALDPAFDHYSIPYHLKPLDVTRSMVFLSTSGTVPR
jgi:hypothetical protein